MGVLEKKDCFFSLTSTAVQLIDVQFWVPAQEHKNTIIKNLISLNMSIDKYSLYNSYFRGMSKKKKSITKHRLQSQILHVLRQHPTIGFNYKQLSKQIGVSHEATKQLVRHILEDLLDKKKVAEVSKGKFKLNANHSSLEGTIEVTKSGNGYVLVDQLTEDIFIHRTNMPHLISGDRVEVSIVSFKKSNRLEGIIDNVILRNSTHIAGRLIKKRKNAIVKSSNPSVGFDVSIPFKEVIDLDDGLLVVCEILDWGNKHTLPSGRIDKILGKSGDNGAEIESILIDYNIDISFDKEIEQAANNIMDVITKEDIKKRRDFREITTFTIDPFDAKDFDDALSVQYLDNGNIEVGIHIADVTHYLKKNDIIDKEAQERATSIYLVDRVIPMLPEILSNQLCSLRPKEEKLTFSAVFELNKEAEIINRWFGKTLIFSDKRFTYEDAQTIIEDEKGLYSKELISLNQLAKKLREKRKKNGAISFNKTETKFKLDEQKNPISLILKQSKDAHKLIEEFMLLANKNVAEFIGHKQLPFVYRIHDSPDPNKLQTLSHFLKGFGYNLKTENKKVISKSMNTILDQIKDKEEANMIETLTIRTMAKAIYTTENIGHYGLAFDYYSHFTSPIRRYPDVMVHRLLENVINGGKKESINELEKLCKHASEMEIIASKAERDSIKYMQVKFISKYVGHTLEGIVSGLTDFGMFIEVQNTSCEGLIRLRDIPNDFYYYDEANFCIKGQQTNAIYRIGIKVIVKIESVNLENREINLSLIK